MSADSAVSFRPWRSVPLVGNRAAGRIALVDEADYELVSAYSWGVHEHVRPSGATVGPYARAGVRCPDGRYTTLLMHKVISGWAQTDHINHDGLDNRRDNLREASTRQNAQNRLSHRGTSSIYKGVFWNTRQARWQAKITVGGRQVWLGTYLDEAAAGRAYDAAAIEHFGPFACLNFPEGRAAA